MTCDTVLLVPIRWSRLVAVNALVVVIAAHRPKLRILWELRFGAVRFSDLRRRIPEASPTTMSQRLDELVDAKIVTKGRSGYRLTTHGAALLVSLGHSSYGRSRGNWRTVIDRRFTDRSRNGRVRATCALYRLGVPASA